MTESFKSLLRPSHKAYSGQPNPAISSPLYFDLALTNAGLLKNSKFQRCRGKTRGSLMSVNLVRLRWVSMNRARMQTRSSACKTKNKKEGTSKHPLQISRSHGIREILWQLKQNGIGYWRKSRPEKRRKKTSNAFPCVQLLPCVQVSISNDLHVSFTLILPQKKILPVILLLLNLCR